MKGSNDVNNDNNCQNLNIWTPGIGDNRNRPVMVWLHGGGFSIGSANESSYNGENLAKQEDVVVVGINHRLNVFGHLDLSAYDDKYKASANVGIMDIQIALEWIRDNISLFGGDAGNVTLFGQSGGGAKVLSMMTSPYAKGLFHKGIVQSGATEMMGVSFSSKEISQRIGELTLEYLGISVDEVDKIQDVALDDLLKASDAAREQAGKEYGVYLSLSTDYGIEWGPVIDGDYMPTTPVTEDCFADAGKDIPLLIGSNFSEWTHWMPQSYHDNMTVDQIAAFEEAYPMRGSSDAPYVDSFIRLPMLKIMSHKADQGGAPVYAYVFNYGSDPYHGMEISYVFGNGWGSLGKQMSTAWAAFARDGVPAADGLDCIYLHHPAGDYMAAWHDLEDAYRQGKVRALGISNFDNDMDAFNRIMSEAGIKPQIMQIECHPFAQRQETRALAAQYNIQVECWYPIGHADPNLLQNDVLTAIAEAHGKSVVQIILRWHMQEGLCAVSGSTNPDHIQENIEIFDFELTDDEMEQIRDLDKGESGRYFNIDYKQLGRYFLTLDE